MARPHVPSHEMPWGTPLRGLPTPSAPSFQQGISCVSSMCTRVIVTALL